jgi:hypothetical protein
MIPDPQTVIANTLTGGPMRHVGEALAARIFEALRVITPAGRSCPRRKIIGHLTRG